MRPHIVDHLPVDPLGGMAQRHLAESGQVAGRKEVMDGAAGLLRDVDLAFAKPFDQIVGRKIDSSISAAVESTLSGTVSRTLTPEICSTTSLRLSRC